MMFVARTSFCAPRRPRLILRRLLTGTAPKLLVVGLVIGVGGLVVTAPVASAAPDRIIFGASGGNEIQKLEANIGAPLAEHSYARLNGPVKSGRMINVEPNVPWRAVASARPGSAVYQDMVRWADVLKKRSGPVLVAFSHEPMGGSSSGLGNSDEFKAAWKKFHSVLGSRGAQNVEFTWTVTSHSFRVKPSDRGYYAKWYPGDRFVDNIGTAAYNWDNCGPGGPRASLGTKASLPLKFAESRNKQLVLAEWASQASSNRTNWVEDARRWMIANRSDIRAAFYYQTPFNRGECRMRLRTSSEYRVFGSMAKDEVNFTR